MVKCFPCSPFSQCIIFSDKYLAFNIWSVSLSSYIWDEMSVIRQDRQQTKALVVHFGDQLNGIFGCTAGKSTNIYIFHNEWGVCQKKLFWCFFLAMIPFVIPKNFNLNRPPIHIFCLYPQDFWQISDADIFHWIFG